MNKYELVFGHTHPRTSPVVLARAMEAARKRVIDQAPAHGVEAIFAAVSPKKETKSNGMVTNGMHLNISLWDGQNHNILGDTATTKDPTVTGHAQTGKLLARAMLPLQSETVLLHAPYPESYQRFTWESMGHPPTVIETGQCGSVNYRFLPNYLGCIGTAYQDKYNNPRSVDRYDGSGHIENRLAGADADPYCVILATLTAMYHALKICKLRVTESGASCPPEKGSLLAPTWRLAKSQAEAAEQFAKGTLLQTTLNAISGEEKLGDRFCQSVLTDLDKEKKIPLAQLR